MDALRHSLFREDPVFSGQEATGFVVFPLVPVDAQDIRVTVKDVALRFDLRDEPSETVDIVYRFQREVLLDEVATNR